MSLVMMIKSTGIHGECPKASRKQSSAIPIRHVSESFAKGCLGAQTHVA